MNSGQAGSVWGKRAYSVVQHVAVEDGADLMTWCWQTPIADHVLPDWTFQEQPFEDRRLCCICVSRGVRERRDGGRSLARWLAQTAGESK